VPKPKPSTIKLQVFKGREAKLNKAIFHILAHRGPCAVSAMLGEIRRQRGLQDTRERAARRNTCDNLAEISELRQVRSPAF